MITMPNKPPILTEENYFSVESNMYYMGSSQFKTFADCESRGLAEVRGEYKRPESIALLVGSYVDAHFSGTLDLFRAQHPQIYKRDGNLKAEYNQANGIIARLERDRLYMLMMSGFQQTIKTGTIAGVPFKIKIDSLLDADIIKTIINEFPETADNFGFDCPGAVVDGKIMRDLKPIWNSEFQVFEPFVTAWGYDIQGAIYTAVEGHGLPFFIAAATKEAETDLTILSVPHDVLLAKLYEVEDNAPRYHAIKQGKLEPTRCGKCDWCRSTKVLTRIFDFREIV